MNTNISDKNTSMTNDNKELTAEEIKNFILSESKKLEEKSSLNNEGKEKIRVTINSEEDRKILNNPIISEDLSNYEKEADIEYKPNEVFIKNSDGLVDIDSISITEEEKEIFFRSILLENDSPFHLQIKLLNNKISFDIYAKTILIENLLSKFLEDRCKNLNNNIEILQTIQLANIAVSINSNSLWKEDIDIHTVNTYDKLEKLLIRRIELLKTFNYPKLILLINACRIFEVKQSILTKNVNNPNFWIPLNTVES